jgi:hypothetical protein
MNGCCVQLHGLQTEAYNGKRGVIVDRVNKERRKVLLDHDEYISVKTSNLCSVFCIGLPREYRIVVQKDAIDKDALARAIAVVDSRKFYIMYMGATTENDIVSQHFIRVRIPFFSMAMKMIAKQDKEPLMRVYVANYSQDDPGAKIIFGDSMAQPGPAPGWADLSSELAQTLSMFEYVPPVEMAETNMERELARIAVMEFGPAEASATQNKCGSKRK